MTDEQKTILAFLRAQAEAARKAQRQRLDSAATWRADTADWEGARQLAERMGERKISRLSRAERHRLADVDERIATKHAREAEMYEAIEAALATERAALQQAEVHVGELLQAVSARTSERDQARDAIKTLEQFYAEERAALEQPERWTKTNTDVCLVLGQIRDRAVNALHDTRSESVRARLRDIDAMALRLMKDFAPDREAERAARAPEPPPDGAALIVAERRRQVEAEGWTPAHDDMHKYGEMALSAARYAVEHTRRETLKRYLAKNWVWGSCWWKPKNPIRNLVRAGALIAAEIDRLQRAARGGGVS